MNDILAPLLCDRLGLKTLKKQVERIGLTATIDYLLPVILPDSVLPRAVLEGCREAIRQRQNILHNKQRHVRDEILKSSIRSVRQMCELLESLTNKRESIVAVTGREN